MQVLQARDGSIVAFMFAAIVVFTIVRIALRAGARGQGTRRLLGLGANNFEFKPGRGFNIAARGILLEVSTIGTRSWMSGVRVEQRTMTVDVEIPGRAPYEVSAYVYFPTNLVRDLVPGAQVELRVHASNRNRIYIVGLGAGYAVAAPITVAKGGIS